MLEDAFQENNKILEATHKVIMLVLNEQRQEFRKINERLDKQEAFNRQVNENFKQLEILKPSCIQGTDTGIGI